ncbi:MAG: hypothetical protein O2U61_06670, partial [Candidatus Bathyarchaeota archaeon]|nr:hypothetical protein [Candidatus Bathyarchaeota archaeon]
MTFKRIFEYFLLTVCISVIFSFFVGDMIWRSNIIKGLSKFPHPRPYYGLEPVPGTSLVPESKGVLGADFSQVFFSAQAIRHRESAYKPNNPEFRDPWGRPPAYPPLTNHLYIP